MMENMASRALLVEFAEPHPGSISKETGLKTHLPVRTRLLLEKRMIGGHELDLHIVLVDIVPLYHTEIERYDTQNSVRDAVGVCHDSVFEQLRFGQPGC